MRKQLDWMRLKNIQRLGRKKKKSLKENQTQPRWENNRWWKAGRQQQKMEMCTDHINKNSYNQFWGGVEIAMCRGGECLHKSDGKSSNREREKDNVPDEEYCLSLFCYCIFFFLSFIHLKFKEIWKRKTLKRSKNSKYRFFLFFFPPDMKLN